MRKLKEIRADGNPLAKPVPQKFQPPPEPKPSPIPEKKPFSFLDEIGLKKVKFEFSAGLQPSRHIVACGVTLNYIFYGDWV